LPAGDKQLQYTKREPLGVVAGILPWNSPLMIAAFKTPAALAAGNTIVLKCAEDAPLTILKMAEVIADILPAGVLNVVTGKGSVIGEALNVHPDVDKVSFTGSTSVGRHVAGWPAAVSRTRRWSSEARARTSSSRTPTTTTPSSRCCCRRASPVRDSRAPWV